MPVISREKCRSCPLENQCRDSFRSWTYFIIGLIATVAIRIVTIFHNVDPIYSKIAWYVGIGGFFVFFLYKYRTGRSIWRRIESRGLVLTIERRESLGEEDYREISAILCALSSKKERINYFFIFLTSIFAMAVAVYLDFLR